VSAKRILIAGETWISNKVDVKGFSAYSTSSYGVGLTELVQALEQYGHEITHIQNHEAIESFPWDVEAASQFDVVMLSDIAADTFQLHPDCFDLGKRTPDRLRVLGDYIAAGGGLIMVGGYMSFSGIEGKAHYQATPLANVLPVEMLGHDDRVETCEGIVPKVEAQHEILSGIDGDWPFFLGYNQLTVKPDAELVMSIEGDPFLVVGTHGDGRTAAFASDCSPHWGSPEFMSWTHYGRFWSQLVEWLGANSVSGRAAA
jgi:uncharacterized membrane protein